MIENPFKIKQNSIKDRSVQGFNLHRNTGDNLLFMPHFSGWLGKTLNFRNFSVYYLFLFIIFFLLLGRTAYLQVFRGQSYFNIAESNRLKDVPIKAARGIIYDRFKKPLVENLPHFALYINPRLIKSEDHAESLRQAILKILDSISEEDLKKVNYFSKNYDKIFLADLSYDQALAFMVESSNYAALQVVYEPTRNYLEDFGLAHILGYVGKINEEELNNEVGYHLSDSIGKTGIEKQYEEILKGKDGSVTFEVDALGREKGEIATEKEKPGTDLILSIDLDVQKKLFEIVDSIVSESKKPGAVAIAMDPNSGELLGLVSYPSYDPNLFTKSLTQDEFSEVIHDPRKPLFMRAISGEYPAGSIFKMVLASAALQEQLITDSFTVESTGGLYLGNRFYPDWRPGGHGITNIYHALADSVNTFFYVIGGGYANIPGLGVDIIAQYAKHHFFGSPTGIDLPSEAVGHIPDRQTQEKNGIKWYQGDTYNLSIGQGSLLVTPVQIARYMSLYANGNHFATPHLVKAIEGVPVKEENRTQDFLSKKTIDIIRTALARTATSGTAQSLQSVSVSVSGKTGTAQFNNNKEPHSWFAGYAPSDNPSILVVTLVEEGGDRSYAVTIARQFLEWYFLK